MSPVEFQELLSRFEADPDSELLAAMLAVALVEVKGYFLFQVDALVEEIRSAARVQLDMKFAGQLLTAKGDAYRLLLARMAHVVGFPPDTQFRVILAPNECEPWVSYNDPRDSHDVRWTWSIVSVGATWVKNWYRAAGRPRIARPLAKRRPAGWVKPGNLF